MKTNNNRYKKYCLMILAILHTLFIDSAFAREWEPEALANKTTKNDLIFDTDNYIDKSLEAYKNIQNYIQEIQDLRRFSVYVYFIDSMSKNYQYSYGLVYRKDIDRFVNDIAWHLVKGNVEADKNSLIILFSIEDRQNRIRTGENVRKFLSDSKALNYLNNLKSKMRSRYYTEALEDLMYNINWRITKDTSFYDFLENLVAYIIIIGFCVCCCAACFKKKDYPYNHRDYVAESKLEKIKRISEKNKNNAKFVEDNCIICLEEFTAEEKAELIKDKNNNNKENENLLNNNNNNENHVDLGLIDNNFLDKNANAKNKDSLHFNHKNGDNNLIDLNHGKKEKGDLFDRNPDDIIRVNDVEIGKKEDNLILDHEEASLLNKNAKQNLNEKKEMTQPLINHGNTNLGNNNNNPNEDNSAPTQNLANNKAEKDKDKFLAVLDCGHTFHSLCIVSWNKSNNTCPICRKSIEGDDNNQERRPDNNDNNNNNNNNNYDNCQPQNQNTNLNVNNNNDINLIDNILFVQYVLHPNLRSYNYDYSNGFSWAPPVVSSAGGSTNYSAGLDLVGGLFGAAAGGASSGW